MRPLRCQVQGAYPRRRGGNYPKGSHDLAQTGLSPQARGEQAGLDLCAHEAGPIPAGAGGTREQGERPGMMRAYPRRRGGNHRIEAYPSHAAGLSPQARGEPVMAVPCALFGGPIPAGAGGTAIASTFQLCPRAYPRRRGGNGLFHARRTAGQGLSPQARGELLPNNYFPVKKHNSAILTTPSPPSCSESSHPRRPVCAAARQAP